MRWHPSPWLAILVCSWLQIGVGGMAVCGYLLGYPYFYAWWVTAEYGMALNTGLLFMANGLVNLAICRLIGTRNH